MIKKFEFSFEEVPIGVISELSGWYCWYVDWTSVFAKRKMSELEIQNCIENIIKFYDYKNFSCSVRNIESEFGERFNGQIQSDWTNKVNSERDNIWTISNSWESFVIWIDLLTEQKIPIYFGESENLYDRMNQHVSALSNTSSNGKENFGKRFNSRRKDCNLDKYLKPTNLKVRIFSKESNDILEIERLVNVIIKPINGVK